MKYGQIGDKRRNERIYRFFGHLREVDQRKFVRKFREQPDDSDQIMHTFMELVLGAYLSSRGFTVRHDYVIDGKTPDWSILDTGKSVVGIVELTNFHIDKVTENEIGEQLRTRGAAWYWRDEKKCNVDRLYHCIGRKAQAYTSLVEHLQVPYVVGVCAESKAAIDFEEVCICLFDEEAGLFDLYPQLSGVLFFEPDSKRYLFKYARNQSALRLFDLPSGVFLP